MIKDDVVVIVTEVDSNGDAIYIIFSWLSNTWTAVFWDGDNDYGFISPFNTIDMLVEFKLSVMRILIELVLDVYQQE